MYRIGIDLGGTFIKVGVVDEANTIIGRSSAPTGLPCSAEAIADNMTALCTEAAADAGLSLSQISSIGIGTPGAIDPVSGTVIYSCNLDFHNTPLCELVSKGTGLPAFLENDANAAALGEYAAGAGALDGTNAKNFIMITLGTGIGGGIIMNGRLYSGSNYAGGELGHMVIVAGGEKCNCGRLGCFERYASASALVGQMQAAMTANPKASFWTSCDGDINNANGKTFFKALAMEDEAGFEGEKLAGRVFEQYIDYLAAGIINYVNIFQPDVLCIGGGISAAGERFIAPLHARLDAEDYARDFTKRTQLVIAKLGNDAGIIGAALLGAQS